MNFDYLILALKNLKHRGIRSWLTLLGIFIGVTAVVALISFSAGTDMIVIPCYLRKLPIIQNVPNTIQPMVSVDINPADALTKITPTKYSNGSTDLNIFFPVVLLTVCYYSLSFLACQVLSSPV